MTNATPALPRTANIISPLTGKLIGGIIAERHDDDEVTILFAGLRKRGKALTIDDVLAIEKENTPT